MYYQCVLVGFCVFKPLGTALKSV